MSTWSIIQFDIGNSISVWILYYALITSLKFKKVLKWISFIKQSLEKDEDLESNHV